MESSPLQKILGPVSQEEFLDHHWQKRSLLVQDRNEPWPFAFDRESFFSALPQCYHLKMVFKNDEGQHKELDIESEQAREMYEAGHTLCATRVNYGNPGLQRYLDGLQSAMLGSEFQMNSYLSPHGSGFGVHYDYHSVWVLQLEGTKRWQYADEPAIKYPATNCVYPLDKETFSFPWYTVERPTSSMLREVVLEPGDMLYLPTGAWHKTKADGYSLSITMGHEPVRASTFVTKVATQNIWSDEASRRHLPFVPQGAGREKSKAELRETFEDALATLRKRVDNLSADRLMAAWDAHVEAEQQKRVSSTHSPSASALAALFSQTNEREHAKTPVDEKMAVSK